jgi:hypothetical protein
MLLAFAVDAAAWRAAHDGRTLPLPIQALSSDVPPLPADARRLQREWLDGAESDTARGEYLSALVYRFGDRSQMFELLSSDSMRQVAEVAALSNRHPGQGPLRVLDLAAGSGSMLLSVSRAAAQLGYAAQPLGVELNPRMAPLATATLYLAGLDADIQIANSLIDDPFHDLQVNLAISQPPFGLGWQGDSPQIEERHRAGWYPWGLPPHSDGSWLFASRLIEKLVPASLGGGRAVTFVASGALRSPSTSGIRERLLVEDFVETIIALPAGLTQASIPVFGVVFNNAKSPRRRGQIQLVDLRASSERSRLREAPRRLRPGALDALQHALQSTRDGVISRTVARDHFLKVRRLVSVVPRASGAAHQTLPHWRLDLPRDSDVETALQARYGPVEVKVDDSDQTQCDLDIETVFEPGARELQRWLKQAGWPATRLSALLTKPPTAIRTRPDRDEDVGGMVLLPTTESHPASLPTADEDDSGRRRLALRLDDTMVRPDFVVGWFNSPLGIEVRARAQAMASSGTVIHAMRTEPHTLLRFCDEVTVPVPPLTVQQDFAAAQARMDAAAGMANAARREAWSDPSSITDVCRRFDPLFDRSLTSWIVDLPYPVGSALWAYETTRQNPHAAHRQAFHVWEAYAAFFASVLLSALAQDPILKEDELPQLRQALAAAGLDITRVTFGTWSLIVQRLSSRFRSRLRNGDADDRSALLQTFGGISPAGLNRLLDSRIVDLIVDANGRRNAWTGHSGSVSESEMQSQTAYLTDRLDELRELVSGTWRELQCVRAGDAYMQHGRVTQKVELVIGANAPFQRAELTVGQMMERGELYLCADGAAQPLPLHHFVVLRGSPGNARSICYFYNRHEGNQVRLVTYQLADASEVTEDTADFVDLIDDLLNRDASPPGPRQAHDRARPAAVAHPGIARHAR